MCVFVRMCLNICLLYTSHCAPDAVRETADRLLPGIPEALRAYNLRHTKKVILDRSEAGIRKKTLMINLPESAKMAKEDLEYILPEAVSYTHLDVYKRQFQKRL